MGLLGKIIKTGIDIATLPIDAVKDVVTLGGSITDEESAVLKKGKRLMSDVDEMRDAADKL